MAGLKCVEQFLKDFEALSPEEKNQKVNNELAVEALDVLSENGYNITVNDGVCNVEGHYVEPVNETPNAIALNNDLMKG